MFGDDHILLGLLVEGIHNAGNSGTLVLFV